MNEYEREAVAQVVSDNARALAFFSSKRRLKTK